MKKILLISIFLLLLNSKSIASGLYAFLKKVEEDDVVKLQAYLDSGGVWTIGYGSIYNYDLKRAVKQFDTITKEQAERYLQLEADNKLKAVKQAIKVPLNKNQTIALGSFVYNVGKQAFLDSTLLKTINQKGTQQAITAQFMRWVYDNGVFVKGLENRRKKEVALYFS